MDLAQLITSLAGVLGFGIACFIAFFLVRSGVLNSTTNAQSSTIDAMGKEIQTLRDHMEDAEKENKARLEKVEREWKARLEKAEEKNAHMEQTVETICAVLKQLDLVVTVDGELVSVEDRRGRSTKKRIPRVVPISPDDAI